MNENKMKKLKIYLDTSIINFLFADDAPEYQSVTIDFFENYLNEYDVFISEIVYLEINKTNDIKKRDRLFEAIKKYDLEVYEPVNDEIEDLARMYIDEGIIPEMKFEDALHIAYSTYFEFDILLSWNFRHLANIKKQVQVNSVNKTQGFFKDLNLFNPMEVIYEK